MENNKTLEQLRRNKEKLDYVKDVATKQVTQAAEEFLDKLFELAQEADISDLEAVVDAGKEIIDPMDKIAFIAAYVESHDESDSDKLGVVVIDKNGNMDMKKKILS